MFRNNSLPENPDSDLSISDEDEEADSLWPENLVSLAENWGRKKENRSISDEDEEADKNDNFVSLGESSDLKKENPDSDRSISDEEADSLWPGNFISLAETSDRKKKGMGIASQLDLLEGAHQNDVGFFSDDEVEAPDFDEKTYLDSPSREVSQSVSLERDVPTYKRDNALTNDEGSRMPFNSVVAGCTVSEILDRYARGRQIHREVSHSVGLERDVPTDKRDNPLTNDEGSRMPFNSVVAGCTVSEMLDRYARGKQIQSEPYMWSAADDGRKPVDKDITTGCRPKMRKGSSSHCQEHKKEKFWSAVQECKGRNSSSDDDLPNELETRDYGCRDISISDHLECPDIKQISVSNLTPPMEMDIQGIQHERSSHSMAELLYELQGKGRNSQLKCNMGGRSKGKMRQHRTIRRVSSSGKDVMSDDEASDVMDSGSSTDNEGKVETPQLAIVESKRKTMAEKFQEAIGSSVVPSFTVLNKSSSGVFARLQQVLQRQKERDTEYFKNLQTDIWPKGEARCLDVKIMSRSYDAKMIVCQCSLLENEESSLENPQGGNFGKIWSIIFSPRVCGDVDLEIANLIRIHPPWKEIQVLRGGEIIILATYYSQIYT